MNKSQLLVFVIIFFNFTEVSSPSIINQWVIWNVGQGQWLTLIQTDECLHFDAGGEFYYFKTIQQKILKNCALKLNRLYLSHWDYDHYSFIPILAKNISQICWQNKPHLIKKNKLSLKTFQLNIKPCPEQNNKYTQLETWTPFWFKNSNESSSVFKINTLLTMGDLPQKQEQHYVTEMHKYSLHNVKILILGHHGSKTSTSLSLLENLPSLTLTIASARYAKYKHPHQSTLKNIYKFNKPLLKTEDWGNIWIEN